MKGLSKTYYVILLNIGRDNDVEFDSLIINELQLRIPYLIAIDPSKMDIIEIQYFIISILETFIIPLVSYLIFFIFSPTSGS